MIKGHIVTSDRNTYFRLLSEIMAQSDFKIIAHTATSVKYYFVSAHGHETISELILKEA